MTTERDFYLDVSSVDGGLKIVSRHPHSPHHRQLMIGVSDGRLAVNWGYNDKVIAADHPLATFADATPLFALKGNSEGVDSILEALRYPRDERPDAARFLLAVIPSIAPPSLISAIDASSMDALRAVNSPSILNMDFYSGAGERAERRRQAAKSIPLLAGFFANILSLKMTVDRSKPLTEAVIGAFNSRTTGTIGKGHVRRLAAVTEKPFGTDIETIVEFSSRIPADWVPSNGRDWKAFCLIADGVVNKLQLSGDDTAKFLKGCSGRWGDFATRFVAPIAEERPTDEIEALLPVAFQNLSEMLECFTNVVIIPLAVHGSFISDVTINAEGNGHALRVAKAMIFGEKSAPSLVTLARRWHSQRAAILDATRLSEEERQRVLLQEVPIDGWPSLFDPVMAPNGLWLVPLNTPEQLTWEGGKVPDPNGVMGLHHCVGGYSTKCRNGNSHIVSIREVDQRGAYHRISTVEFDRLSPTSDHLVKLQHYGYEDSTPVGKAKDAVDWLMESVALGQVKLNRNLIEAFDRSVLESMDGVQRFCGYDWRDGDTLARALAPWGPYVDSAYRNLGFDGLIAMDELTPIRDSIAPELISTAMALRR